MANPTIDVVPYFLSSSIGCNVYTHILAADTNPQNIASPLKEETSKPSCMTIQTVPTMANTIQNSSGIDGFFKVPQK